MNNVINLKDTPKQGHQDSNFATLQQSDGPGRKHYSICKKRVVIAFATEFLIIAVSLVGAWFLSERYAPDSNSFWIMMLAPVAYAAVEFSRVPLAFSVRTQNSIVMKAVALMAVLCIAGVTIKSISQLGYLMFQPRLIAVADAKRNLFEAKQEVASYERRIAHAQTLIDQRKSELEATEDRITALSNDMTKQPGQNCAATYGVDKRGNSYKGNACRENPVAKALAIQIANAQRDRTTALSNLNKANEEKAAIQNADIASREAGAAANLRDAIFKSQIHTFTAMVFGKDPIDVSEGEISTFLRIFVFLPAILASLGSTLLMMTAVQVFPKQQADDLSLTADESRKLIESVFAEAAAHVRHAEEKLSDTQRAAV